MSNKYLLEYWKKLYNSIFQFAEKDSLNLLTPYLEWYENGEIMFVEIPFKK